MASFIDLPAEEKQSRLLSTHNCVPVNKDLGPKHLDRAVMRAKGELGKLRKEEKKDQKVAPAKAPAETKNGIPEELVDEKPKKETKAAKKSKVEKDAIDEFIEKGSVDVDHAEEETEEEEEPEEETADEDE